MAAFRALVGAGDETLQAQAVLRGARQGFITPQDGRNSRAGYGAGRVDGDVGLDPIVVRSVQ